MQLHIVYKLDHEDVEPLFRVCHELRSMVSYSLSTVLLQFSCFFKPVLKFSHWSL